MSDRAAAKKCLQRRISRTSYGNSRSKFSLVADDVCRWRQASATLTRWMTIQREQFGSTENGQQCYFAPMQALAYAGGSLGFRMVFSLKGDHARRYDGRPREWAVDARRRDGRGPRRASCEIPKSHAGLCKLHAELLAESWYVPISPSERQTKAVTPKVNRIPAASARMPLSQGPANMPMA